MDSITLTATKCPHGVWHWHDAILLEDGTVVADNLCRGGVVEVEGVGRFGISHALAITLRHFEEQEPGL